MNDKFSTKETLILDCALALLIEAGDAGLTLRKLADRAGMRLSNVQYYFKSRDDVLAAMVARYFKECTDDLVQRTAASAAKTMRDRIHFLVLIGLSHGQQIGDLCRAFREIWAVSSRDPILDQCLIDYYRRFADVMADFAFREQMDESRRDMLKALLIPYFEGYSITARSLSQDVTDTAVMLTDLTMRAIETA